MSGIFVLKMKSPRRATGAVCSTEALWGCGGRLGGLEGFARCANQEVWRFQVVIRQALNELVLVFRRVGRSKRDLVSRRAEGCFSRELNQVDDLFVLNPILQRRDPEMVCRNKGAFRAQLITPSARTITGRIYLYYSIYLQK